MTEGETKDLIARLESLKIGMALQLRPYSEKAQKAFFDSDRRELISVDDLRAVTDTIEFLSVEVTDADVEWAYDTTYKGWGP